ncbi:hypothetical protein D6C83_01876 [Aureobasidium pullulans]|uniref:Coatomer subunit delta n=1 Tax=Aureobasidium pullulans TaxID=5580 RepID=A0A4T0E246_AURPU|nr:hypothetical protein D6C83_01876 [Aureobasidium pullulans]
MVVLAASICTRGGKAVLSRQFREMQRSRIEGLLASFPKLADSGTQHTTVEQDNVRFVYQPLDELYMVLITNRQSNILQDIDSLHLFAQVVTSICRSLDEREILRNAFELLSAFDELVTLGYRENLTLSQIKTFLDMESHEERIQDIISRNKELEATEERKRKAKQLEMQRKEATRSGRSNMPSAPSYPTYTPPPTQPAVTDTYDSYNAEKNKSFQKSLPARSKGMQLGKKTKTTSMFEQVRGDLGPEAEAPLVPSAPAASAPVQAAVPTTSSDRDGIHITVAETISAKLSREGSLESFEVKGDLQLRITDPSLTQVQLALALGWWLIKRYGPLIRNAAQAKLPSVIFKPLDLIVFTPISWLRDVHPSLVINGFLNYAPLNLTYYTSALYVSFGFMYYLRRYKTAWWEKYNYVLAAALSAGVALSGIIIFFAVQYHPVG